MSLNLNIPKIENNLSPQIIVIGVGGAGGNAVNNMIQTNVEGVDFLIANTDAQAIQLSLCEHSIQLGRGTTQGLGAGSRPDVGRAAAEEALDDILSEIEDANMVFITAGMGGGTGTGGSPVIARAARESGILTVGVVTKPFHFEGVHRMRLAEAGINELAQYVDTLIVIPNQNLFRIANEKTTFADAFKMADDVLRSGVRGVTDLMVMPGLINLDFADIRAVMTEMGKAMMGTGEAEGESRALSAAEAAISNPLLDEVSMKGARGLLVNITGGPDLTLFEVDEAANRIRDEVDPEANIIFGSTFDQTLEGRMRVSVMATGIEAEAMQQPRPVTLSLVSNEREARAAAGGGAAATAEGSIQSIQNAAETGAASTEMSATPAAEEPVAEPAVAEAVGGNSNYAYSRMTTNIHAETAHHGATMAARSVEAVPEMAEPAPVTAEVAPQTATIPVANTAVATAEDRFIAPKPIEPEPTLAPEAANRADPFAAAAMANGSRGQQSAHPLAPKLPGRKKGPGFFAKMTGSASRALQASQGSEQRDPATAKPEDGSRHEGDGKSEPTIQPRLSGIDPSDRTGSGQSDDDLLDIPAFLRRQAN